MTIQVVTLPSGTEIGITEYDNVLHAVVTHVTLPTDPQPPVTLKKMKTKTVTNIRNAANAADASILGQLKAGVVVDTMGMTGEYYYVRCYIHKSMLVDV